MCGLSDHTVGTIDNGRTDEAMILESRVLALNAPSSRTLKNLKIWFKSTSVFALRGRDEHLFENEHDLVALAPVETDRLNLFLSSYFGWFFKVCDSPIIRIRSRTKPFLGCWPKSFADSGSGASSLLTPHQKNSPSGAPQRESGLYYFPAHRIQRAGAVISVMLSAILLIGAIVCLTAVSNQSTKIRLGMIVLFTCLFAGVVGLLTNARRAEIFGSTAA